MLWGIRGAIFRTSLLATASAFAMSGIAHAQSADMPIPAARLPNAGTGVTTASADTLDNTFDIVVTAQRRTELSRDVPISIVSLSGDQLDQANVHQLADISKLAPGIRFRGSSNFQQPSIRGVSTALVGSGVGSNVGIYIDGFYSSTATGSNFQLLNIRNVEVLKGPQGTLFGRNTTGGAILVTTARPSTEPSATFELSYGRFDAQRYQAYATAGLSDTVAVDIEGLYRKGDSYFRNIVTNREREGAYEDWSVRAGLSWEAGDRLSFLLRYQHSDTDDPSYLETNALVRNGRPLTVATTIPGAVIATRPGEVAKLASQPAAFHFKADAVQFTAEADLGFADLASYTQYRHERSEAFNDLDYAAVPYFHVTIPQRVKIFTEELLLASKPGPALQWTIGAFFLDQKDRFPPTLASVGGGSPLLTAETGLRTRSFAAFADITYQVTDSLFLTGGLRYTNERGLDAFRISGPLTGNLGRTDYPEYEGNYLTPRFVIRYKPNDRSSFYLSYTRGIKAGIIDTNDSAPTATIRPEKLTSYEAGFKYGSPNFSIDLSAYYYDYKDLQVQIPIGPVVLVRNAANSRIYGGEAQARYSFGSGFELSGGLAYNNARYKRFPNSQAFIQCLDPVACGSQYGLFPVSTSDSSGFRMQNAPEFTASISPSFSHELADGTLRATANLYYTSSFFFDSSEQFRQPGYATLDLRAEWTDPSDRFTLAVYGANVTDKDYLLQVSPNTFGIGALWAAPATYGISLRVKL